MLKQIRWKIWIVIFAVLVMLGISYYYGVVREAPDKVTDFYSVVLYQHKDNEWATLYEGIRQAEEDFKVKVNYFTMGENDTAEDQVSLIEREVNAGSSGILFAAVDSAEVETLLGEKHIQVPLIAVETGAGDNYVNITADNYKMGQALGNKIAEDIKQDNLNEKYRLVTVVTEYMERDSVQQRYEGLVDALEESGENIRIQNIFRQKGDFSLRLLIGTSFNNSGRYVAALDKYATEEAAAAWESKRSLFEPHGVGIRVYGIGNTAQTVNDLDNEKLWALVYQNEFNMGYLGIQALVHKDKKGWIDEQFAIKYKLVTRETLYESENERLLFPSI